MQVLLLNDNSVILLNKECLLIIKAVWLSLLWLLDLVLSQRMFNEIWQLSEAGLPPIWLLVLGFLFSFIDLVMRVHVVCHIYIICFAYFLKLWIIFYIRIVNIQIVLASWSSLILVNKFKRLLIPEWAFTWSVSVRTSCVCFKFDIICKSWSLRLFYIKMF